ncbi:spirocyclase AveC family protein [Mycobacteroides abscessus]|uniref:spirocyclase AveC family protein n=1 Tax=Mycobacteroides abscessus TaxID=36809 RepID=UPI0005DFE1A2|nr:spirocyclase AveC family protein [Mycobacteroides abscessus]CPS43651.1 postpolyketide modification protein [Mycobacteroides abscessus]CPS45488.1 postpolyketide modification protein [Mycobacteroides abscessus]CPS54540.1 postpolyketide modification protein [Mycobacteroides abscessus]CPT37251.1 postpolyketide modification protein [Mycobacteroides abscessus]CPT64331.1 postpolyketide modification protein [Mycobacteroides abscessus]
MTRTAEPSTAVAEASAVGRDNTRPSGAVWVWAALGSLLIVLAVSSWTRWLLSPQASPVDPGQDPYEFGWVIRLTEVISLSVFVFLLWFTLIRPAYRERTLTLDGKLFLGGLFASCLDVLCQVFNPTWAMNAHSLNLGTWAGKIPGYAAPQGDRWAWSLGWCMPAYIWLGVGAAIVGCAYLNFLRHRLPRLGTAFLYGVVLLTFIVAFGCLATAWNRTGVYSYVSSPNALTLWADTPYRLPVTELIFIASYCLMFTWLRDSADGKGRCAVDRGVDALTVGPGFKTLLSALAVIGWAGFTTLVAYQVPNDWIAMNGGKDSIPALPSYMQGSLYCGQPGKPLCANQYLNDLQQKYGNTG